MRRSSASDLLPRRRRIRSPVLSTAAGARQRKSAAAFAGRQSGPNTPLLQWKLCGSEDAGEASAAAPQPVTSVSARKLAAGIWRLGFEVDPSKVRNPNVNHNKSSIDSKARNGQYNYISHEAEPFITGSPHSTTETKTKWDNGPHQSFYQQKLLEYQPDPTNSTISVLQSELDRARYRVSELESERRSAKKKLDHFLRKISEEKALWRSREHEKIRSVIDAIKDDLNRERKNRHRLKILSSKLVNELAEVKLSTKRYMQDYEKERKARELMEEVCDELAKEIAEDKAEIETLKRDSNKTREEFEEERKMLQMAEVWREERVQMKLVDAKLTLERKYAELSELQNLLEGFITVNVGNGEAEMLLEAVKSVKINNIKEFAYQPPAPTEDIFSVFEELCPKEDTNEREIEQCYDNGSRVHTVSPETDIFLEKPKRGSGNGNGWSDRNGEVEDESGWETVSRAENGSSNSLQGSEPSVNNGNFDIINKNNNNNNQSVSGTDWDDTSEVCSTNNRKYNKKGSNIIRLWRNSELSNGRVSNNGSNVSPDLSSPSEGQWSSPDSSGLNPNMTQKQSHRSKGCIDWTRGTQKQSLKSKLVEARVESKKVQLKHALRQKI